MNDPATGAAAFGTTHWSKIAAAREGDSDVRRESLNFLVSQYWRPIYAYLRHVRGLESFRAEDLTQEFMIHVLEHDMILRADQDRGRFRAFVKAALKHFLSDRRRWEERIKRGGGRKVLSLDVEDETWMVEATRETSPEEVLDRQWMRTVLDQALQELEMQLKSEGHERDWELFATTTTARGKGEDSNYEQLAARFGFSKPQVGWKLMEMRRRLREVVRQRVAQTVSSPHELEEEMAVLGELLE